MNTDINTLTEHIATTHDLNWHELLDETLHLFDCSTGTLHFFDPKDQLLHLKAYRGIPDFLLPKMSEVPIGKGMAGIAAERKKAVQVCNLQTDDSGVVRPGAKDTQVEGAITMPLIYHDTLYGTLGIAKSEPYEFSEAEINDLQKISDAICKRVFVDL